MNFTKMDLHCKCILCCPNVDGVPPPPPTVLCPMGPYWANQLLVKCCCTLHPEECLLVSLKGVCRCPRCCLCLAKENCDICSKKHNNFFVCLHQENPVHEGRTAYCELYLHKLKQAQELKNDDSLFKAQ